jgi:general secretion pathway protein L
LRRQEGLRLKYDGETLIVEFDRGKEPVELGRLPVAGKTATEVHDRLSALLKLHKLRRGPVDLVFLGGLLLNRDVELPVEVADSLPEVLAFEMDRLTPFRTDEIYYDYKVKESDPELKHLKIGLSIARRVDVDRLAGWARDAGLEPRHAGSELDLDPSGPDKERPLDLLPQPKRGGRQGFLVATTATLAVLTLLLSAGALYASMVREQRALTLAEARIAELRTVAEEVRTLETRVESLQARRNFVMEKKRERPISLAVLDEVTRRVPDGSWLLRFIVKDGDLRIIGFAEEPSRLVRSLEESPMFSGVRFAAPVTRDPRLEMDRFNLTAQVETEGR